MIGGDWLGPGTLLISPVFPLRLDVTRRGTTRWAVHPNGAAPTGPAESLHREQEESPESGILSPVTTPHLSLLHLPSRARTATTAAGARLAYPVLLLGLTLAVLGYGAAGLLVLRLLLSA